MKKIKITVLYLSALSLIFGSVFIPRAKAICGQAPTGTGTMNIVDENNPGISATVGGNGDTTYVTVNSGDIVSGQASWSAFVEDSLSMGGGGTNWTYSPAQDVTSTTEGTQGGLTVSFYSGQITQLSDVQFTGSDVCANSTQGTIQIDVAPPNTTLTINGAFNGGSAATGASYSVGGCAPGSTCPSNTNSTSTQTYTGAYGNGPFSFTSCTPPTTTVNGYNSDLISCSFSGNTGTISYQSKPLLNVQ